MGIRVLDISYTGIVLGFEPGEAFFKRPKVRHSISKYLNLIKSNIPSLGQLLMASFLLELVGLFGPISQQLLVDRVILPKQESWFWGIIIGIGVSTFVSQILSFMRSWVIQSLQLNMDFSLIKNFIGHMLDLPIGFFLQRKPGDLIQRIESNAVIRDLFSGKIISAILDTFLVTGYAALMLAYNFRLGLVVVFLGCSLLALHVGLIRYSRQLLSSELAAAGNASSALFEALGSIETIKASGAESAMVRRWTDRMVESVNTGLRRSRLNVKTSAGITFISSMATTVVFWLAGMEVLSGTMTIGVFSAFLTLKGQFLSPLGSLVGSFSNLQLLGSHLERLDDVLDVPIEISGKEGPDNLSGGIVVEDVRFAYTPGDPPVIKGVNLEIRPSEKIALVGPTGAGKSTLARLLIGILIPTEGKILYDGIDIRKYNLEKLRNRMGILLQENFIFNDTVRANIALNRPDLPIEKISHAAKLACIDDVIEELPNQYDTLLGENGARLSGGQRQRIALARALAHEPPILLLDEATSSLDLATEARVHANLLSIGCTRIIISHRLDTVRDADRILVIDDGTIIQEGTYEGLLKQKGLFQTIVGAARATHD